MSFFGVGSNPFATPVGQKIEQATSETLPSEDWALNIEICDMICQIEEGPRDAMKALRKRLTMQPKIYTIIMYTLTVLETCVKNCGRRMHHLACSKDFVQELVKLIGPKNDPPTAVQEKVLMLIQSWAETFRHQPELSGVSQVYADLKHKGVLFPIPDPESTAPIITPQRTINSYPLPASVVPQQRYSQPLEVQIAAVNTLNPEQKAKLQSELDLVESNAKVLAEMLNEITTGNEETEDIQLLQDLHSTCRAMQERVVELVGRINDDLLTADLLRVNDDLNIVFNRYDEYMKKVKVEPAGAVSSPSNIVPPPVEEVTDAPLIDLGEDGTSQQMAALGIAVKPEDVDFDAFAQSRTSVDAGKPSIMDNGDDPSSVQEQRQSDFDEMEHWLSEKKSAENEGSAGGQKSGDTISSLEFDRFLAERATAAETLPSVSDAASPGHQQQRNRTLVKEDQTDKPQFSL